MIDPDPRGRRSIPGAASGVPGRRSAFPAAPQAGAELLGAELDDDDERLHEIGADIFDAPTRRSRNVIGPRGCGRRVGSARNVISIWNT